MKKTDIDKATTDKPVHVPIDPDQPGVLVISHNPTRVLIKTRGWTLREVLSIMGWNSDHVWAVFKRPWRKDRGAVLLAPSSSVEEGLAKLNEEGGSK